MRICVICNHSFGFRAIKYLMDHYSIAGTASSGTHPHVINRLKQLAVANQHSFITLTKESLKTDLKTWLNKLQPDVVFVFSFAHRIPDEVLSIPKFGFINFHPSILPSYRGPDPVFWQLRNGETRTGITAHKMERELDSGDILCREYENINEIDTYGILTEKLSYTLVKCVSKVVNLLQQNNIKETCFCQDREKVTYYKKPAADDLKIRWQGMRAEEILSLIKACNPNYDGAITSFRNDTVRILEAATGSENISRIKPGTIINEDEDNLCAAAEDKNIIIKIVYMQEGIFTGPEFRKIFQVQSGERFF